MFFKSKLAKKVDHLENIIHLQQNTLVQVGSILSLVKDKSENQDNLINLLAERLTLITDILSKSLQTKISEETKVKE